MIGFGFTIYNFYRGFLEDLATAGRADGARNLGLALVTAGTLAMLVAVWDYWSVNRSLTRLHGPLEIPDEFKQRWIYAYLVSAVLVLIGLITLVFMLRTIEPAVHHRCLFQNAPQPAHVSTSSRRHESGTPI